MAVWPPCRDGLGLSTGQVRNAKRPSGVHSGPSWGRGRPGSFTRPGATRSARCSRPIEQNVGRRDRRPIGSRSSKPHRPRRITRAYCHLGCPSPRQRDWFVDRNRGPAMSMSVRESHARAAEPTSPPRPASPRPAGSATPSPAWAATSNVQLACSGQSTPRPSPQRRRRGSGHRRRPGPDSRAAPATRAPDPATPRRPVEKVTHDDDLDNQRRTNPALISASRLRLRSGRRADRRADPPTAVGCRGPRDRTRSGPVAVSQARSGAGDIGSARAASTQHRAEKTPCTPRSPRCPPSRTPSTA